MFINVYNTKVCEGKVSMFTRLVRGAHLSPEVMSNLLP